MIGIIGFESLRVMQYLNKYTDVLDEAACDYEVIYWNRSGDSFNSEDERYISFDETINTYVPIRKKVKYFYNYTRFVYSMLKNQSYDQLIILTTQTAVILSPLLLTYYRKKYVFDYRDITFEKNPFFRYLIRKIFKHAHQSCVSSPQFIEKVGMSDPVLLAHNCKDLSSHPVEKVPSDRIRIVYWGMVRQVPFHQAICDRFGNDPRFELTYHGEGFYKELQSYCMEKGYTGVQFTGAYHPEEIPNFAKHTDILLNAYDNDHKQQPALTVKLYDAMRYQLPMMISKDSYMETYLNPYDVYYPYSSNDNKRAMDLAEWYEEIKAEKLKEEYLDLNKSLQHDEQLFKETIKAFAIKETSVKEAHI